MKKVITEHEYPIRLMFGIGNNMVQGFSIVYEKPNGSAGSVNVWYDDETFKCVKFTDSESFIKLTKVEKQANFFSEAETKYVVNEITINRKFMNSIWGNN